MPTAFFCIKNMFPFRFYNLLISRFLDYCPNPHLISNEVKMKKRLNIFRTTLGVWLPSVVME